MRVARHLGHNDLRTTLKTYSHIRDVFTMTMDEFEAKWHVYEFLGPPSIGAEVLGERTDAGRQ